MPHFLYSTIALSSSDDSFSQIITKVATPLDTHELLFGSIFSPVGISNQFYSPYGQTIYPRTQIFNIYFILNYVLEGEYVYMNADTHRDQKNWSLLEIQVAVNHLPWVLGTDLGFSARKARPLLTAEPFLQSLSSTSCLTRDDNPVSGIYLLSR